MSASKKTFDAPDPYVSCGILEDNCSKKNYGQKWQCRFTVSKQIKHIAKDREKIIHLGCHWIIYGFGVVPSCLAYTKK